MARFISWTLEIEETTLHALRLRAAKAGIPEVDLARSLLREALAAEIGAVSGVPSLAAVIQTIMDSGETRLNNGARGPSQG